MLANPTHAKKMCYQGDYVHEPSIIRDIFDGSHYWALLETFVPISPFTFSPIHTTLPLVFQQMVLVHSSSVVRRAGRSSFLITISLWKSVFRKNTASMSGQSQVQRNRGIGIPFAGHLFRNLSN